MSLAGKSIIVLFGENTRPREISKYDVKILADVWESDGHQVHYLFGTKKFVPGDICLVHFDASVVPEEYFQFARQYPRVLNGQIRDIRKSTFSANLVKSSENYSGPVIVKTDLNHGGWPEMKLAHRLPVLATMKLAQKLGMFSQFPVSQYGYRIYDSCNEVPDEIFDSPDFIVEKFIPEMEDGQYCLNIYKFLGSVGNTERLLANSPIITGLNPVERQYVETPPEIENLRQQLNIDYGKLDFVTVNGKVELLDVNKTIGTTQRRLNADFLKLTRHRASGLYSHLQD